MRSKSAADSISGLPPPDRGQANGSCAPIPQIATSPIPELFEVAQNCDRLRALGRTRIRRMFAFSRLFTAGRKGTQIFHIKSQPNNLTS